MPRALRRPRAHRSRHHEHGQRSRFRADRYALIDDGEYQLAWHAFEKVLALSPNDSSIHVQIGKLLGHDLCRVDDAIATLERAIHLRDAAPEAYVELAIMLRSSARLGEAELAARRGLDAHQDHAFLLEALSEILIELDRKDEAIAMLEKALNVDGANAEIQALLVETRSR